MITGIKGVPDPASWEKAKAIMTEFGIHNHYLADLLGMEGSGN
jgi:hypothetical protein